VGAGRLRAALRTADGDAGLAEVALRVAANCVVDGRAVHMCGRRAGRVAAPGVRSHRVLRALPAQLEVVSGSDHAGA
jgi:hypothetical protein